MSDNQFWRTSLGMHKVCQSCNAAGEKQQKGKGISIPFLQQLPAPIAGGENPRMPVGTKLEPGVPLPTWICDTVSARPCCVLPRHDSVRRRCWQPPGDAKHCWSTYGSRCAITEALLVISAIRLRPTVTSAQGGKLQIGAPHGNWQMVVVYRGKHDPVCPAGTHAARLSRVWNIKILQPSPGPYH